MRTKIKRWANEPIIIPRSAFFTKYALFIYFGATAAIVGVPVFDLTQPQGYSVLWGITMAVTGVVALVAVSRDAWERIEMWAAAVLWSLSLAYVGSLTYVAYKEDDPGRQALAAGITLILVVPLARFLKLASKHGLGKKK